MRSQAFIIYLGEGETPLQPARHLGSWLGLTNMSVKRESLNPTGSFKARGMAVVVAARSSWAPSTWWRRPPATPAARWPRTLRPPACERR